MLAKFFFCVFIDGDEVEKDWSIKDLLLYGKKENFFLRPCGTDAGIPERARWAHLARWGGQSERPLVDSAI